MSRPKIKDTKTRFNITIDKDKKAHLEVIAGNLGISLNNLMVMCAMEKYPMNNNNNNDDDKLSNEFIKEFKEIKIKATFKKEPKINIQTCKILKNINYKPKRNFFEKEEDELESVEFFEGKCPYTSKDILKKSSIDHIIPQSTFKNFGKIKKDESYNLLVVDSSANPSKSNKNMIKWFKEHDYYTDEKLMYIYMYCLYMLNKYKKDEMDMMKFLEEVGFGDIFDTYSDIKYIKDNNKNQLAYNCF